MEKYITIGEIIRHYRKERNLSQEELCVGICDRKHLSHIENNKAIPTLDIINQLSQRLQINLYETYALMLHHHDITTHQMIEYLNLHLTPQKRDLLLPIIEKFERNSAFQSGVPKQYLLHAKTLYTSNVLHNPQEAIHCAIEGLSINPNFSIDNNNKKYFSNVELSLFLSIMVNYCRMGNLEKGQYYYDFLYNYINNLFSISHYATNRNDQFELRLLAKIVYNHFIFFKSKTEYDISHIDNTLNLMKSLHSNCMLPELLLCKAYIQTRENDLLTAKNTYLLAHQLGLYLYEESYINHIEQCTLLEYFTTLTEQL